uniref:Beta-glucosidase A n=1 Tax=uncultured bacterium Contigcl_23 TaxID=1393667 RepID=W0FL17_9BACT|nr:beta-glucosidase A [uncultured bacterium Contigcl_23]
MKTFSAVSEEKKTGYLKKNDLEGLKMPKIYAATNPEVSSREIENGQRSRAIAPQGMVLLENNGVLPLKSIGNIALYGDGARRTVKGGTGSGDVMSREVVTVEMGLQDAGFSIVSEAWIDRDSANVEAAREAWADSLRKKFTAESSNPFHLLWSNPFVQPDVLPVEEGDLHPDQADTAVYVLSRNSGEGADRKVRPGDYEPLDVEIQSLTRIAAAYAHTVLVLNVGGVMDMKAIRAIPGIDAILLMSQAGNYGGYALADVLTGRTYPSGHLTTTWGLNYRDYPSAETFSHRNGDLDDEYYYEGIYVGYRYFDTFNVPVQYPFGYGLSYTTFELSLQDVSADEETVSLSVKVTNTGELPGREVVQVYYSAPEGNLEKPYQELAAFGKTGELAPGASEVLPVSFPTRNLASYDPARAAWILEKGPYIIRFGVHSRDTHIAALLALEGDAVTSQLRNRLPLDESFGLMSRKGVMPWTSPAMEAEKAAAKVIPLDASKIRREEAAYSEKPAAVPNPGREGKITLADVKEGRATLDELAGQLTPYELATLCVGADRGTDTAGGPQIGAASAACPGAAGDTTSLLLEDRGIRNLILPDGPAGLRLSPIFRMDSTGKIHILSQAFPGVEVLMEMMPKRDIPEDAATYYQYTTAIPIATMLAQTWDEAAIEAAGDIVGGEMEIFGCDLWLAPGMNIHRNPLCGRNFEYYSEDPLLAGKCAAADTRGVQKHKSAGTTIKHYAFNNQEDNRSHVNSHVDERAIREIYLKGFEIAVREAQPRAIMTSYNLINGEHTANSYDLVTAIARDEWGFAGIVMTDWGTTGDGSQSMREKKKYGASFASGCIKAGNDLIMPGSDADVQDILNSLGKQEGEVPYPLTLGELQACAKRIISLIMKMER